MKIIVAGCASGKITRAQNPINFLGAVEKETGRIRDERHDLFENSRWFNTYVKPYKYMPRLCASYVPFLGIRGVRQCYTRAWFFKRSTL